MSNEPLEVEKTSFNHVHDKLADASDPRIEAFTEKERKAIIRRVDLRLVVTLGVMYCISLIDRTNLGSASIAGMNAELGMNAANSGYTLVSLVFFFPYILCQPVATVAIRKLGPRRFLAAITLLWGGVMIGTGFVRDWQTMIGTRILLGVFEAGLYPGCVYILSTWYTRYELQKRYAVFYLIGIVITGFGGILAYGLMQMSGLAGLTGWRWIFIIEGVITCVLGIASYLLLVDFPELSAKSWKFLNEAEAVFIVARIDQDRDDAQTEPFHLGAYLRHALDSKIWGFAWLAMLTTTNSYAIAYFLPIILRSGMGFDIARAQCLVTPPYVAAAIVMYIQAYYGDKWHLRGPIIVFNACLGLIGLPLLGYTTNNAVRYFGVFLATISCNANVPALLTYQANNIRGQWKRALASATFIGAGGIGGIIGTTVFRDRDSPTYGPGILACIIANALIVVIVAALSFKFYRANKRVDDGGKLIEGLIGFKYTL